VTGSSFEIKTEADSSDITEHQYDDKTKLYLCTVLQMVYMVAEFDYTLKRHWRKVYSCNQHGKAVHVGAACAAILGYT